MTETGPGSGPESGLRLSVLDESLESAYEEFVLKDPHSMAYASVRYKNLLADMLPHLRENYLLALDGSGSIRAALPLFLARNPKLGLVINSLPFFGSQGNLIMHGEDPEAEKVIWDAWRELTRDPDCVSATVVSSPFEGDARRKSYEQNTAPAWTDQRIGQITPLPQNPEDPEQALMDLIDSARRRNVRKARKSGVTISEGSGAEEMQYLADTHVDNIGGKGGQVKPPRFFECLEKHLRPGKDFRLYTARLNGEPAAALLVLWYNRTVEYFVPVISGALKSAQPLSLLAFQGMLDAVEAGMKWWNWGGTWLSQEGVHAFKKKWGSRDMPYTYYIARGPAFGRVEGFTPGQMIEAFPYCYVVPFDQLP